MSKLKRALIAIAGLGAWLAVFGFVLFAAAVMREPPQKDLKADAILVLTGGQTRIAEGARLLKEGRAKRMLISGVNKITRRDELMRLSGLPEEQFNCCVDLGYAALDTIGNAEEARDWADARDYHSIIVVTASYHMPRSLAELGRTLPNTELIPYPVVPKGFETEAWWLHFRTTRLLISEYLKFLPSAARFGVVRVLRPWHDSSFASAPIGSPET
jgi:uncharacterized SAM-binding protein YcdF (DUF218 family)